jgi:hypothetical protein
MTILSAFVLALTAAAPAVPAADIPEPNPSQMSKAEIRAHNAKVGRNHPYFIRCVKAPDTGSLVARRALCRTNARWAPYDAAGRDAARTMADDAVARSASSSN